MSLEDTTRSVTKRACISCGEEFVDDTTICPQDGTILTPLIREEMVGKIIGDNRYLILELLGGGGMGLVYKAKHLLINRLVAIKMMHPQYVSHTTNLKRFQQEAKAASSLSHQNLPSIFDFGLTTDGIPFLVMDYLDGTTLAAILDEQEFISARRAVHIFSQTASALAHAHSKGVIHRDLKPANIMLIQEGTDPDFVKIVDFGIAKLIIDTGESAHLTQTGEVFGSPLYMSPEQCKGVGLDNRSDVYSLGCVMYRSMTGVAPFFGKDPLQCMYKHVNESPLSTKTANPKTIVPAAVEAVLMKCLNKDPEDRYQDMFAVKSALDESLLTPDLVNPESDVNSTEIGVHFEKSRENLKTGDTNSDTTKSSAVESRLSADQTVKLTAGKDLDQTVAINEPSEEIITIQEEVSQSNTSQDEDPRAENTIGKYVLAGSAVLALATFALISLRKTDTHTPIAPATNTIVNNTSSNYLDDAQSFIDKGNYFKAEQILNNALADTTQNSDTERRQTLLNLRGDCRRSLFELDDAIKDYKQVLKLEKKAGVAKSPDAAHALNGLGEVFTKKRDYKQAGQVLQNARNLDHDFSGDEHIEVARTSFALGNLELAQGRPDRALKELEAARAIVSAAKGENAPESARVYNALAETNQYLHKYKEAEAFYAKAQNIRERQTQAGSTELGDTLQCQGTLLFAQHKFSFAEKKLEQSLALYKKVCDTHENEILATNYFCLGVLYDKENKLNLAENNYQQAYNMRVRLLGANDTKTKQAAAYYANLLKRLNKPALAERILSGKP